MRKAIFPVLLCMFLSLFSCSRGEEVHEATLFAMDTVVTVRLSAYAADGERIGAEELERYVAEITSILARLEQTLSRTVSTSDTSRFNGATDGIESENADFLALTRLSLAIAADTDGAFSPSLGALTELWNVGGGGHVPTAAELADALAVSDYRTVTAGEDGVQKTESGLKLDFGGIAKGYAAAQCIDYLRTTRCAWGLLSLGGNVAVFGEKSDGSPFRVGVTDPLDPSSLCGMLDVTEGFVSVSGGYDRYFEADGVRYHHIFDPLSGMPADSGLASVAILSHDGTLADALSTALFVMGEERALAYYDTCPGTFEAILIRTDGTITLTPGLRESGGFTSYSGGNHLAESQ